MKLDLVEISKKYPELLTEFIKLDKESYLEQTPVKFSAYKDEYGNYVYHPIDSLSTNYSSECSIVLDKNFNLESYHCYCSDFNEDSICSHITFLLFYLYRAVYKNDYPEMIVRLKDFQEIALSRDLLLSLSKNTTTRTDADESINIQIALKYFYRNDKINNVQIQLRVARISDNKYYKIKNITKFLEDIETEEIVGYGQKLEFKHRLNVFDSSTRSIINYLRLHKYQNIVDFSEEDPLYQLFLEMGNDRIFLLNDNVTLPIINGTIKLFKIADGLLSFSNFLQDNYYTILDDLYVFSESCVYKYTFNHSLEKRLLNYLRENQEISLYNSNDVIVANYLPKIGLVTDISEEFTKNNPVPAFSIDSYFDIKKNNITVRSEIHGCDNELYKENVLREYNYLLKSYGFKDDKMTSLRKQYSFLTSDLVTFKDYGKVYTSDELMNKKIKKQSKTFVNVNYGLKLLELEIINKDLTAKDIANIIDATHKNKNYVLLEDNTIMKVDKENTKELETFFEDFDIDINNSGKIIEKSSSYLLKFVKHKEDFVFLDKKASEIITEIVNYQDITYDIDEQSKNQLRPYQLDAYKWLKTLDKYNFGGILADDMGLGKTLETIVFLKNDKEQRPTLVVCPMSLVYNWKAEIEKWSTMEVVTIRGNAAARLETINSIENKKVIYLCSYDSLRNDVDLYNVKFRFVIIDEAQAIKNRQALKSIAVKKLNSDNKFALTGTPIENSLSDLWSIFDFVNSGYLSNYNRFKSQYETLIMNKNVDAMKALNKRITPFILRRTKGDVLSDLPDKQEIVYTCQMGDEQRKLYDSYLIKIKEAMKSKTSKVEVLTSLMRLRQVCVNPMLVDSNAASAKYDMLFELLDELLVTDDRVLIFSQFTKALDLLKLELNKREINYSTITGKTKSHERLELVDEFNENSDVKVFLISLKAGGTGLNLVGANTVIHLDPWWNVSAENQASDRAYRIGQTRNVTVFKLITANTIEDKIIKLQNLKKDLANDIVGDTLNEKLSEDDLKYILEE